VDKHDALKKKGLEEEVRRVILEIEHQMAAKRKKTCSVQRTKRSI